MRFVTVTVRVIHGIKLPQLMRFVTVTVRVIHGIKLAIVKENCYCYSKSNSWH